MIITTKNGQSYNTDKDLTAPERHILQKLFVWETMAISLDQFREKKEEALLKGWNNSGRVKAGPALKNISRDMEKRVTDRLAKVPVR